MRRRPVHRPSRIVPKTAGRRPRASLKRVPRAMARTHHLALRFLSPKRQVPHERKASALPPSLIPHPHPQLTRPRASSHQLLLRQHFLPRPHLTSAGRPIPNILPTCTRRLYRSTLHPQGPRTAAIRTHIRFLTQTSSTTLLTDRARCPSWSPSLGVSPLARLPIATPSSPPRRRESSPRPHKDVRLATRIHGLPHVRRAPQRENRTARRHPWTRW